MLNDEEAVSCKASSSFSLFSLSFLHSPDTLTIVDEAEAASETMEVQLTTCDFSSAAMKSSKYMVHPLSSELHGRLLTDELIDSSMSLRWWKNQVKFYYLYISTKKTEGELEVMIEQTNR